MYEKSINIVLTGFRATGKSSVGRMLAEKLRYSFIDTDILLCERLGAPIADIVASHGWDFFRQAERRLLMEVTDMVRTVLATGGGAIEHLMEWRQLRGCCYVVWLDADVATIRQRMSDDPHSSKQRPPLTGSSAGDEIEELLQRRIPLYLAGSDLHLSTDGKGPAVLVESIIKEMRADPLMRDGSLWVAERNEREPHRGQGMKR